jgi:bifunctional DNA-binding transcriptional regulator/antitoxin component of YhaV-PrlF toxin-antitoxin module
MTADKKDGGLIADSTRVYNDDGHTSIPLEIRKRLGIEEGDRVGWVGYEDKIMVVRLPQDE